MRTRQECIDLIASKAKYIKEEFGVKTLRLFGSVAREQQHEGSDVDVCVDMPPRLYQQVALQQYLEANLACSVDLIRDHPNMNPYLKQQIEKDGIDIIR